MSCQPLSVTPGQKRVRGAINFSSSLLWHANGKKTQRTANPLTSGALHVFMFTPAFITSASAFLSSDSHAGSFTFTGTFPRLFCQEIRFSLTVPSVPCHSYIFTISPHRLLFLFLFSSRPSLFKDVTCCQKTQKLQGT